MVLIGTRIQNLQGPTTAVLGSYRHKDSESAGTYDCSTWFLTAHGFRIWRDLRLQYLVLIGTRIQNLEGPTTAVLGSYRHTDSESAGTYDCSTWFLSAHGFRIWRDLRLQYLVLIGTRIQNLQGPTTAVLGSYRHTDSESAGTYDCSTWFLSAHGFRICRDLRLQYLVLIGTRIQNLQRPTTAVLGSYRHTDSESAETYDCSTWFLSAHGFRICRDLRLQYLVLIGTRIQNLQGPTTAVLGSYRHTDSESAGTYDCSTWFLSAHGFRICRDLRLQYLVLIGTRIQNLQGPTTAVLGSYRHTDSESAGTYDCSTWFLSAHRFRICRDLRLQYLVLNGTRIQNLQGPTTAVLGSYRHTDSESAGTYDCSTWFLTAHGFRICRDLRLQCLVLIGTRIQNLEGPTTAVLGSYRHTDSESAGTYDCSTWFLSAHGFRICRDLRLQYLVLIGTRIQNLQGPTTAVLGSYRHTDSESAGTYDCSTWFLTAHGFRICRDLRLQYLVLIGTQIQNLQGPTTAVLGS